MNNVVFNGEIRNLDIAYGGLWLGYSFRDAKPVHPFTSLRVGGGTTNLYNPENFDYAPLATDNVFVVEPEIGVEVNFFQWFKVVGSVGYRFADVGATGFVSSTDLSGMTAGVTLRFGWFGSARASDDD